MRISMCQMNVRHAAVEENLERARQAAGEAKRKHSDLLVLPELWATGFPVEGTISRAGSLCSGFISEVSRLSKASGLYLLGSALIRRAWGTTNTAMLFSPQGTVSAQYDKIHLFRLMDEYRYLAAGYEPVTVRTGFGILSIAICYDLRFPELFRRYAVRGTQLVVVPAAWPRERIGHWQILLQARAIENGFFVAGCNQSGPCGSQVFGGRSAVIGPYGEAVSAAGEGEEMVTVDIDLSTVREAQERVPVLKDLKPRVYGNDVMDHYPRKFSVPLGRK